MLSILTWVPLVSAEPEDSTWEMYRPNLRPDECESINETIHNANINDEASVG